MAKTTKKASGTKKTVAKKARTTSRPTGRASTAKNATSKVSTKLKGLNGSIKLLAGKSGMDAAVSKQRGSFAKGKTPTRKTSMDAGFSRRPPNNPDVPQATIDQINNILNDLKSILDDYAQHLRALDRKRLNGVGIKKLGFIERSYEYALENAEFLPHYLTIDRFGTDIQYFMEFRSLFDLTRQISEKLWNIVIQSSDIAYTDALEFYASVREASKRRVDAAETIHHDLSQFFRRQRMETEEPTEKQAKKDFNALLHGKHDGKLVIENIKPKLSGGKRKLIDETFRDKAQFKVTKEGDFVE
ncbi:MAG: hypothetical protein LBH44_14740 [Treponema sp.]|jgi:hypothetical protein|nr:hypothetical protein [Treponema sp.]